MEELLTTEAAHFCRWNFERIRTCLEKLPPEAVWQRPNDNSNSIGNQVIHLCGNLRQWVMTTFTDLPDRRTRSEEFSIRDGYTAKQLVGMLGAVTESVTTVLAGVTAGDLKRTYPIQGRTVTGMHVLLHAVEHYSYHTGQIIFYTKEILDEDLDFYKDWELD